MTGAETNVLHDEQAAWITWDGEGRERLGLQICPCQHACHLQAMGVNCLGYPYMSREEYIHPFLLFAINPSVSIAST